MKIGKRIYYDKLTGDIIVETGEIQGYVQKTTVDEDIATYTALNERVRDTFDVIELNFGEYAQDFAECNWYRVNPETKELEFSYPDPNIPPEEPVYQKPLSLEVQETKQAVAETNAMVLEFMETILMGGM